jgi:hypothetical protein
MPRIGASDMANIQLLKKAIEVLDNVPKGMLHMNAITDNAECGTAHCLAGWLSVDPWFRKHTEINDIIPHDWNDWILPRGDNGAKLANVFDISLIDSSKLFDMDSFRSMESHAISKREVKRNLQRLIDGKPTIQYKVLRDE